MSDDKFSSDREIAEIRNQLLQALESPGVQGPSVGIIDLRLINTSNLSDALLLKTSRTSPMMDTEVSSSFMSGSTPSAWPEDVEALFTFVQLILDVRHAFIRQDWDSISSLLEEILSQSSSDLIPKLPDVCQLEIQTIRYEVENRYIISSLSSRLMQGRLQVNEIKLGLKESPSRILRKSIISDEYLEQGDVNIYDVSYADLFNCLEACKVIQPRTPEASRLVYTAEIIVWFRKSILLTDANPELWNEIYEKAMSYLSQESLFMISPMTYPELKLIKNTAMDNIICEKLESSLGRSNVNGKPAELDISSVSIDELQDAISFADNMSMMTERSRGLLYYCLTLKQLREHILRAAIHASTWKKIRELLVRFQSNAPIIRSNSAAWSKCREEILLISHSAQVYEIRELLEESCLNTIAIYNSRASISINETLDSDAIEISSSSLSTGDDLNRRYATMTLPTYDLEGLLEHASTISFPCQLLDKYIECANHLITLRKALNYQDFVTIESSLINPSHHRHIYDSLSLLDITLRERNLIVREFYNMYSLRELQLVLYPIDESIYSEQRLKSLKNTINVMDSYYLTCLASQQLLACAKHIFLLRQGIFLQDSQGITDALKWFEQFSHRCPADIIEEVKDSFKRHQNDILATALKQAFRVGKLTMISSTGAMNYSDVDTSDLSRLIAQAADVFDRTEEVEKLLDAADIVYNIRVAQKERNTASLKHYLSSLSKRDYIHPLIYDEIAMARSEVDNEIAVGALLDAIHAFNDEDSKPLAFIPASLPAFAKDKDKEKHSQEETSTSQRRRRYSYQNAMDDRDIDIDTINLDILDEAMSIAKDHGLLSSEAKCLYRTVALLRLLRQAMKLSDWTKVEDILYSAKLRFQDRIVDQKNPGQVFGDIHPAAKRELEAVEKQLEMRSAILDISRALKSGSAKCSNGIVDTTTVSIVDLEAAITRSEKGFSQLVAASCSDPATTDTTTDEVDEVAPTYSSKKQLTSRRSSESKISSYGRRTPSILSTSLADASKLSKHSLGVGEGTDTHQKAVDFSMIQSQTQLLIESAKLLVKIRELLLLGEIEKAGSMADDCLNKVDGEHLHLAVRFELQTYSKEISKALNLMKLCASIKDGINSGNVDILAAILLEVSDSGSVTRFDYDLGLLRVLDRANHILSLWKASHHRLLRAKSSYETNEIRSALQEASSIGLKGSSSH
jgi:hypothetical protein